MGEFGWAYISCEGDDTAVAVGPTGSLQFHSASNQLSGSSNLMYTASSGILNLTGTLNVSGTINANVMNIDVTNKNVINLDASGSTKFGDTSDDTHQFTGSLLVSGGIQLGYYKFVGSAYSILTSDYIIGVSASNYVSLTLPSSSTAGPGKVLVIKDEWCSFAAGSGGGRPPAQLIAISASGTNTIDGNGNYEIKEGNNAAISLYADGASGWFVI